MKALTILFLLLTVTTAYSGDTSISSPETTSSSNNISEDQDIVLYDQAMKNTKLAGISSEYDIVIKKIENERFYVTLLAAMSLISLVISLYLLKNSSPSSKDIVVVTGLNFVVFGSLISVLTVSTTEQLGAITGILGALGGYLFGTWSKQEDKGNESNK